MEAKIQYETCISEQQNPTHSTGGVFDQMGHALSWIIHKFA